MKNKFKIGDVVKVVKYGSIAWINKKVKTGNVIENNHFYTIFLEDCRFPILYENDNTVFYDLLPNIVGKVGTVKEFCKTQNTIQYSLEGIPDKISWYDEDQLEEHKSYLPETNSL